MRTNHVLCIAVLAGLLVQAAGAWGGSRLGVGAHYNRPAKEIRDDFDNDGLSWLVTYQYVAPTAVKLEVDLEMLPEATTGLDELTLFPQAYILLGGIMYAGLGIGIQYYDGDFADDPIYSLRAGTDLPIGPLHLDINANYPFTKFNKVFDDFEDSRITVAVMLRVAL